MAAVLTPSARPYSRDFQPMPAEMPPLALVPKEGEAVEGRNFRAPLAHVGALAAEQNLLNDFEHEEKVRAYRAKLAATTETEWRYRIADRSEDYNHGVRHFAVLLVLQIAFDPDGSIWREFMPQGFDIPTPYVKARFACVYCSSCGEGFGPGNEGFGHCADHAHLKAVAS